MEPQPSSQPSSSLLRNLRAELMQFPPFSQMLAADVDRFITVSEQAYFAPGEVLLSPSSGTPTHLWCVRQGHVTGRVGHDDKSPGFEYDVGVIFPVGAVMGERPVAATYHAQQDVFCPQLKAADVRAMAQRGAPFAAFLGLRCRARWPPYTSATSGQCWWPTVRARRWAFLRGTTSCRVSPWRVWTCTSLSAR